MHDSIINIMQYGGVRGVELEPYVGYLKFVYCVVGALFTFVWLVRFMHRHRRVRAGRSVMARRWNKLGWRPEAVVKYLFKRKRTAAVPLKFTDKVIWWGAALLELMTGFCAVALCYCLSDLGYLVKVSTTCASRPTEICLVTSYVIQTTYYTASSRLSLESLTISDHAHIIES